MAVCIVGASVTMFIVFYLAHGLTVRSSAALVGTLLSLLATGISILGVPRSGSSSRPECTAEVAPDAETPFLAAAPLHPVCASRLGGSPQPVDAEPNPDPRAEIQAARGRLDLRLLHQAFGPDASGLSSRPVRGRRRDLEAAVELPVRGRRQTVT